ncbi:MAG: hypothetical protein ACK5MA_06160 [Parachlamydiaceae bacterium]
MTKSEKKKLCWNCEGSVSRTIDNCPFCGVYLNPEESPSEEETVEELKAPYIPSHEPSKEVPHAPYQPIPEERAMRFEEVEDTYTPLFKEIVLPLLLLTSGAIAILFTFLLLFFSVHGKLTLQWDAEFWYFYALAAGPLLAVGYYLLRPLQK